MTDPRRATVGIYSIDGRSTEPQLNTPGGDSGEFIVALAVYERELQQADPSAALTRESVRDLLNEYLGNVNRVRRWYLHSDLVRDARSFILCASLFVLSAKSAWP